MELDLDQLDSNSVESLRSSIIQLLYDYRSGPKTIITQLSIALADLTIQKTDGNDQVGFMLDHFQNNPETVGILLEFLSVLPEEVLFNRKIHHLVGCIYLV